MRTRSWKERAREEGWESESREGRRRAEREGRRREGRKGRGADWGGEGVENAARSRVGPDQAVSSF